MDIEDYLTALSGPAMGWLANRGQAQRRDQINNQNQGYALGQSQRAMGATDNLLTNTVSPAAVTANDAKAKATLADNLARTVASNKSYEKGPDFGGKVTGDYAARFASNNDAIGDRIKRSIDQYSTIGAPALRRQGDAQQFLQAGSTVAGSNDAMKDVGARYNTAIDSVRPSPLLTFGSELANGLNLLRAQQRVKPGILFQSTNAYSPGYLGGTSEGE